MQMTESDLLERARKCFSRIQGHVPLTPIRLTVNDLRISPSWGGWKNSPGLYYFVHNEEVVYVGRAVPSVGLGNRIGSQINAFGDPAWDEIIRDEQTVVGVMPFSNDDWHWVATLEVWLIDGPTRPKFNKRF
jgi:hypothetical protein